ncbi:hypothetical protein E2C01_068934 [Portunus trituberculatus]|uniref:Uncharacterized protein n=1 Tax=Portunus trituberculatus TaxID=210409 RepID=A0A5B7HNR9_PORTR|nr:hypothetical protein [Portunus trituberculatus]
MFMVCFEIFRGNFKGEFRVKLATPPGGTDRADRPRGRPHRCHLSPSIPIDLTCPGPQVSPVQVWH